MAFKSEQNKKQFEWQFGLVVGLFIFLQMATPRMLPIFMADAMPQTGAPMYEIQSAMRFNGQIYLAAKEISQPTFKDIGKPPKTNWVFGVLEEGKLTPLDNAPIDSDFITAAADPRGIWLIYPQHIDLFDGTRLTRSDLDPKHYLESCTCLTAASDNHRIYFVQPGKVSFLENGVMSDPVEIPAPETKTSEDQLLFYNDALWYFAAYKGQIHYQTIVNGEGSEWHDTGLKSGANHPQVGFDQNGIFIARLIFGEAEGNFNPLDLFKGRVAIARPQDVGDWKIEPATMDTSLMEFKLVSSEDGYAMAVGDKLTFGGWKPASVELGPQSDAAHGVYSAKDQTLFGFFPVKFLYLLGAMTVLEFILAIIMLLACNLLMQKHRVEKVIIHQTGEREFASLLSRGIAQIIDSLVTTLPVLGLLSLVYFFLTSRGFLALIILIGVGAFLGWIVFFAYYSFLEGRYGQTLGKKLMGIIVVGYDGKPCGIGPALLRTLLRIVDSFFYGAVGLISIGYTGNWQRLGDMAAKTVVIKAG